LLHKELPVFLLESQFLADVSLIVRFKEENWQLFVQQLQELSSGKIEPLILERNPETIFPVD